MGDESELDEAVVGGELPADGIAVWGGQYAQLSYTHLGKGRTEYVPPARVKEVKRQLDTYRKFKELTQEWVTLAIELCKLKQTQEQKK